MALPKDIRDRILKAIESHRQSLEAGTISVEQVALAAGLTSKHIPSFYAAAQVMGVTLKTGPRKGSESAGRPRKDGIRRRQRSVALVPELWDQIEERRGPGESSNDVIARLLRRGLEK